jgi:hypothetical protein
MKVSLSLNKVPYREKMDDIVMAYEKAGGIFSSCFSALLQRYFSAKEKYFPLRTNQHQQLQQPNFN